MCIGIIGGVGPQAGVDVAKKNVDTMDTYDWHFQARDTAKVELKSDPSLDGKTQNAWLWAPEATQVDVVGSKLVDIANSLISVY